MIFGLGEVTGENLYSEVEKVFATLGEKPTFEAERVGKVDMINCRPVKVVLGNKNTVFDLLKKSLRRRRFKESQENGKSLPAT